MLRWYQFLPHPLLNDPFHDITHALPLLLFFILTLLGFIHNEDLEVFICRCSIKHVACPAKELLIWHGTSCFGFMRFFEKFHFLVFLFCLIGKLMLAAMMGFKAFELSCLGVPKFNFFVGKITLLWNYRIFYFSCSFITLSCITQKKQFSMFSLSWKTVDWHGSSGGYMRFRRNLHFMVRFLSHKA